ncbi:MAG: transposase [Bacteroidia bacterium]
MPEKYKDPFVAGEYYHVFHHAVGYENLFKEKANYDYFLDRLNHHTSALCDLTDWCLMPNHFHLIVRVRSELSSQLMPAEVETKIIQSFSNFLNSYTKSINKRYKRRGSMFAGKFKRVHIKDERHLNIAREYVRSNPEHHRLTDNSGKWPYLKVSLNDSVDFD